MPAQIQTTMATTEIAVNTAAPATAICVNPNRLSRRVGITFSAWSKTAGIIAIDMTRSSGPIHTLATAPFPLT